MTGVCSVSRLHDEILWYIFQFNSYPTELDAEGGPWEIFSIVWILQPRPVPPLVTNRRTSQVCRQWRRVMIHSSSIWANGVDLQHLNQSGDDWRREVLIRTGEAPLTVIGRVGGDRVGQFESTSHNMRAVPFALDLLETHWERIQTLIILSNSAAIDEKLYNALRRPAPNLTKFVVALKGNRVSNNIMPFMNQAPNLHTLRTDHLSFNLSEQSWSSKIRDLDLKWPRRGISITEMLHGLESMTSLEVLNLRDFTRDPNIDGVQQLDTGKPTIKLLSLRSFTIHDSNSVIPEILSRITIPPQCTFHVDSSIFDSESEEVSERLVPFYETFFKNNFVHPTVTHAAYSLQYTNSNDSMEDVLDDEPDDDMYILEISFGSGPTKSGQKQPRFQYTANLSGVTNTAFRMAEALLACDLSNVTTLSLCLNVHRPESILENPLFESIYDFLLSFESVERLYTEAETLKFYMGSEDLCVTNVLFPSLDTLYIDVWDEWVVEFLGYRHQNSDRAEEYDDPEDLSVKRIKQVYFAKDSPIPYNHTPTRIVVGMAAMMGLRMGWEGHDD